MTKATTYNTDRQLLFVEKYLETLNGTQAARLAGYKGNRNTLSTVAWENMRKPKIAMLIRQRMAVECMTSTENLRHLARIARGIDITSYITQTTDEDGNMAIGFDFERLRRDGYGDLIKSVSPARGGSVKIEFHDRLGALNSIARHHALFTDVIVSMDVDKQDGKLLTEEERHDFAASILERIAKRGQ